MDLARTIKELPMWALFLRESSKERKKQREKVNNLCYKVHVVVINECGKYKLCLRSCCCSINKY